jgi:hypothetical protein
MQTIDEYIQSQPPIVVAGVERPYRQADLARDMDVHPNRITNRKADGWKIADGRLWSPKQHINKTEGKA